MAACPALRRPRTVRYHLPRHQFDYSRTTVCRVACATRTDHKAMIINDGEPRRRLSDIGW